MEEFFEKLGKVTVGVVISGAAGLLMNILLGRFLSGAEYGTFRVFFSSVLMVGGFLSFGLERRTASILARKDQDSKIASRMSGMAIIFIAILGTASLTLWPYLKTFLGGKTMLVSFALSTALYILYKYSMGAFKGLREEEFVGLQNIAIGALKLVVVSLVFFLGYTATEISIMISLVYLSMVLLSAYWMRENLGLFRPSRPDKEDFKSVLLSNSKQLGEVIVLFSAPIIVDLIGGSSTQAGIMGATITISILPYYIYRSLIHVLLPEVSNQRSLGNFEHIDSRVGLFTWITVGGVIFWSLIGFFFAPSVIKLVYGSGFQITGIQGGIIFTSSGLLLLAVLFTEVLIGFEREKELAKAWIVSLISLVVLTTSGNPITVTATAILVYTLLSTAILTIIVVRMGVKIWKLDLSQIPWKKLHLR